MAETNPPMTLAEYLALSPGWDEKVEWVNGRPYAMSGARPRHNLVTANVVAALHTALRKRTCRTFSSDQRVAVQATRAYLYPDASVACPPFDFDPADGGMSLRNPTVVVEVLSPSTADYDRGAKFEHYRTIASVTDVLFIDPVGLRITHHSRREDGWFRRDHTGHFVHLTGVKVELALEDVFAGLTDLDAP